MKHQFLLDLVQAIQSVIDEPKYASDPDKVEFGQAAITLIKGYEGIPTPPGP